MRRLRRWLLVALSCRVDTADTGPLHSADELPAGSLGSDWSLRRPPAGPRGSIGRRRSGVSFESLSSAGGEGPPSQRYVLPSEERRSCFCGIEQILLFVDRHSIRRLFRLAIKPQWLTGLEIRACSCCLSTLSTCALRSF